MTTRFRFPVHPGTPVRVYRNLHARCWSVQVKARNGRGNAHSWYVAGHAQSLTLGGASFVVYEKGRQRVLKTGVKNVHAYVLGTLLGVEAPPPDLLLEGAYEVVYNPRMRPYFCSPDYADARVDGAQAVWLVGGRVYAK